MYKKGSPLGLPFTLQHSYAAVVSLKYQYDISVMFPLFYYLFSIITIPTKNPLGFFK